MLYLQRTKMRVKKLGREGGEGDMDLLKRKLEIPGGR
jgi:hypothetical protein